MRRRNPAPYGFGLAVLLIAATWLAASWLLLALDAPPLVDEAIYASSAFQWAADGSVRVSDLSAPTSIIEAVWGGMFARVFGTNYTAIRVSSLALTLLSAPFMFDLTKSLGASRRLALFASAAYLFSPLVFVLSASFMTDMHVTAFVVISAAFISRGLITGQNPAGWFLGGSIAAGLAYLSRPHGLVVPIAAVLVVTFSRVPSLGHKLKQIAGLLGPSALAVAFHLRWQRDVGAPMIRDLSQDSLQERFWSTLPNFIGQAVIMFVIYTGLSILPFLPLLRWHRVGSLPTKVRVVGLGSFSIGLAAILLGADPTSRQAWMSSTGMAAVDRSHLGQRPDLWPSWIQMGLLLAAAIGTSLLLVNILLKRWGKAAASLQFLGLTIAGMMAAAVLASQSIHAVIFDRYWVPVVPLVLALAATVAQTSRTRRVFAGSILLLVALFSVVAISDGYRAHNEIVAFASEKISEGIDPDDFDGGAPWSAINYGLAEPRSVEELASRKGPFWRTFFVPDSRPILGVALQSLDGYEVLERREYRSLLHLAPTYIYLIKRDPPGMYFLRPTDF